MSGPMNQGKLEVVKQEMARVNVNILGISELKWTGMGELNSDDHYIYYCGQESLRRNGVAIMVNKRVQNAVLGCNLKNERMISVRFQDKPFNITVIQAYAPGEGNGNPLQCSCLENPRDGGAWWPAVSGVAQSQTRLKRLSSSSSSKPMPQPVMLKKLKLNGSMKTYKTF